MMTILYFLKKTILFSLLLLCTSNSMAKEVKIFKIGYLEAGEYFTYTESFKAMNRALSKKGWGDKIEYPQDAHFSPGWNPEIKDTVLPQKAQILMARDDLDVILAAGTSATRELLNVNNGKTPLLAFSVSDAVKSQFVPSITDSGVDNFTVRIVPERYLRMFQIFHDEVGFNKLGLLYVDEPNKENVTNATDAHSVAKERGFAVLEQQIASPHQQDCIQGLQKLLKQGMDAFFIPSLVCFDTKNNDAKQLFNLLIEHHIPTFARQGSSSVQSGALMGFSTIDFSARGEFLANMLIQILQGTLPRKITMLDRAAPKIALNIEVAKRINHDFTFDILGASDEIYQEISFSQ